MTQLVNAGLPWYRKSMRFARKIPGLARKIPGLDRLGAGLDTARRLGARLPGLGFLAPGAPITVTLQTHGPIERFLRPGTYDLHEGDAIRTLLHKAGGLPAGQPLSLLLCGERVEPSHRLRDGDTVVAMQFVAGG